MTIQAVINGFAGSDEFRKICEKAAINPGQVPLTENRDQNANVTIFVARCYTAALGRTYDVAGLNYWCGDLVNGTKTPQQVAAGFALSEEAALRYKSNLSFVQMMYKLYFNRDLDDTGRNYWVPKLDNGTSSATVCEDIGNSQEALNYFKTFNL